MKSYRGYRARVEYDPEDSTLVGRVEGIRDVVTFYADDVASLEREFHLSVDEYVAFCEERGGEPERPVAGKVLVRMGAALHRSVLEAARREETSLNAWMVDAAMRRLDAPPPRGEAGKLHGVTRSVTGHRKEGGGAPGAPPMPGRDTRRGPAGSARS